MKIINYLLERQEIYDHGWHFFGKLWKRCKKCNLIEKPLRFYSAFKIKEDQGIEMNLNLYKSGSLNKYSNKVLYRDLKNNNYQKKKTNVEITFVLYTNLNDRLIFTLREL